MDPAYAPFSNVYGTISSLLKTTRVGGSGFLYNGRQYNSVENAFQSLTFDTGAPLSPDRQMVVDTLATCPYGAVVYAIGNTNSSALAINTNKSGQKAHYLAMRMLVKTGAVTMGTGWDRLRDHVMEDLVRAKFRANPALEQLLLDTGDSIIAEASPSDSYWGTYRQQSGRPGLNKLGRILMKIRTEIPR